jgi:hypothetical protein
MHERLVKENVHLAHQPHRSTEALGVAEAQKHKRLTRPPPKGSRRAPARPDRNEISEKPRNSLTLDAI